MYASWMYLLQSNATAAPGMHASAKQKEQQPSRLYKKPCFSTGRKLRINTGLGTGLERFKVPIEDGLLLPLDVCPQLLCCLQNGVCCPAVRVSQLSPTRRQLAQLRCLHSNLQLEPYTSTHAGVSTSCMTASEQLDALVTMQASIWLLHVKSGLQWDCSCNRLIHREHDVSRRSNFRGHQDCQWKLVQLQGFSELGF